MITGTTMGGQEGFQRRRAERESLNFFGGVLERTLRSQGNGPAGVGSFSVDVPHLGRQPLLTPTRHQPANPAWRGLWLCNARLVRTPLLLCTLYITRGAAVRAA